MGYERLSAHDAVFLRIEDERQPQHVGSLSVFDGAAWRGDDGRIRIDELRRFISGRLHRVPRMRQRLMFVPYGQGRPIWVDDQHFDIDYHVRLTALPRPGEEDQLLELMGRLQSLPLDRVRPLWELWFVDGLADERVGLIIKTHHSLGDGLANVDLGMALVDVSPEFADDPVGEWRPVPPPSSSELLTDSVLEQMGRPIGMARSAAGALRDPFRAIADASTAVLNVGATIRSMLAKPEPTSWNTTVSSHRRWSRTTVPFETVRSVRSHHDATVNDVVIGACTLALRRFLAGRGESVDDRTLKAMVPVSRRAEDERGETLGNLISMFVVELPVGEERPDRQLDSIVAQTEELKQSGLVDGAESVIKLADGVPTLAGPLTRYVSRNIPMNLVITNIPGPPMPLWLRGAPLLDVFPYVEVVDREGLTIAVLSYCDRLMFGVTADRDVIPDLERLTGHLETAFDELAAAVA